ncbi:hypothetical protein HG536_0F00520 [Torulaspora globosa]|uniref:Mediator of RNA polymerase II transcription subunit 10 n=1 Tax=Torulaspora globosa TaxID=48254 RepID=A0A7G3ZJP1_9SACH|nr:uncharacterized protein HG536_0F00520 [Torulaspora globosa]QLL33727.1 hypothetical protein HG536_0F00520 [Torulaspora globosa]
MPTPHRNRTWWRPSYSSSIRARRQPAGAAHQPGTQPSYRRSASASPARRCLRSCAASRPDKPPTLHSPDKMSEPGGLQNELAAVEQQVGAVIESFVELGVSVYDFPGTSEASQGMVTNLKRNVDRVARLNRQSCDPRSQLAEVSIPLEVVQYIEDGRNPDIYTREFVEAVRRSNQYQRAKMHGLRQLRDSLAEKIVDEFPDLENCVQSIVRQADGKETSK